jgi:hypothetical protein
VFAGVAGLIICGVATNQIFAAGNYKWSTRVEICSHSVDAAKVLIGEDWSTESAKMRVPVLNEQLHLAESCIYSLEKTAGVTEESETLRESIQDAIESYMNDESRRQTGVTWILDAYSRSLTESLIAQAV